MLNNNLLNEIEELSNWIETHKYLGFDPHDIKGEKFFMRALAIPRKPLISNLRRKITLAPLHYLEMFFPQTFRYFTGVKPKLNSKGLGLIARAYFILYEASKGDTKWLKKGNACLNLLLKNKVSNQKNLCWGYPFNWNSGIEVPANTPTSVVSVAVFDAFWEAWKQTQKVEYLESCKSIGDFFINDLNYNKSIDGTICFSYTPLDNFEVHNINLMVSHCLLRLGKELKENKYYNLGITSAEFSINQQNKDGSIFYWSKDQNFRDPFTIDHYHSGFELRALYGIWKVTKEKRFENSFAKYYEFYRKELFIRKKEIIIPKIDPKNVYPIDIHSCAEAILLAATISNKDERALEDLKVLIPWVIKRMKLKSGYYRYLIRKIGFLEIPNNTPYMRWGQSWMLLALVQAYLCINKNK